MLVGDVVDAAINTWLSGTYAEGIMNTLAEDFPEADDLLTLVGELEGPSKGGFLAMGGELVQVIDRIPGTRQCRVVRAVRGTSRQMHRAGTVVEANPRYWRSLIVDTARDELWSWPNELYRIEKQRRPVSSGANAIQLIPDVCPRRVLAVERPGQQNGDDRYFTQGFRWSTGVLVDDDVYVYLDKAAPEASTYVITIATDWRIERDDWNEGTDLADVGLSESMFDALVLGTTWRLVTGREIRHLQSDAQGQSRDPQEIPAGAIASLGTRLLALRDQRLSTEARRLADRYFG